MPLPGGCAPYAYFFPIHGDQQAVISHHAVGLTIRAPRALKLIGSLLVPHNDAPSRLVLLPQRTEHAPLAATKSMNCVVGTDQIRIAAVLPIDLPA